MRIGKLADTDGSNWVNEKIPAAIGAAFGKVHPATLDPTFSVEPFVETVLEAFTGNFAGATDAEKWQGITLPTTGAR